jgi:hypothetical protein
MVANTGKATLEVQALGNEAFDFLEARWASSTPRLMFGSWMKQCFDNIKRMNLGEWPTMFQLFKPEQLATQKAGEFKAHRFIFMAAPPGCVDPTRNDPALEARLRKESFVFQCLLGIDEKDRIIRVVPI